MSVVTLDRLIDKMKLENPTPEIDADKIEIKQYDVNRPALQLTGVFEHFDNQRIQIIGHVEHTFNMQRNI